MKSSFLTAIFSLVLLLCSCNRDIEILAEPGPEISSSSQLVFETKLGRSVTLAPTISNADDATYQWSIDGRTVGSSPSYTFQAEEVGTFYIDFKVTTANGFDATTYRIEVLALTPPVVALYGRDGVYEVEAGVRTQIVAHTGGGNADNYSWKIDGEERGTGESIFVEFENVGTHNLTLSATNEDGQSEATITLSVVEHLTGSVRFPAPLVSAEIYEAGSSKAYRNIPLGMSIAISPTIENFRSPSFEWSIAGEVVSADEVLLFTPENIGRHEVQVTVRDEDGYTLSATVEVECCDVEGTFRRSATESSTEKWNKIYEYIPAAGQFINDSKSGFDVVTTHSQVIAYAEKRLKAGDYVSLGGWGGSLVAGFDHSISNDEGADFVIKGNTHEGSSEPAIVWVMQDVNGNGQPDDVWYELRGSEYDAPTSQRRYAVTYFRPVAEQMSVVWSDNRGSAGKIERMSQHKQPTYYPLWIPAESFTLYGSLIAHNTTQDGVGNFVNNPYAWGYADNAGSDSLASDAQSCSFDIANAVRDDGEPMPLAYIDFVKVQCAINHSAGALGEVSTEIVDIYEIK
ncbi:MAG: PKD domain containing protein [Alistipes sp.]|nr:PKD domain containing protein [Alistipes sp.]